MLKTNTDVLEGKWRQLRGQAHQRWGKLTDSELDRIQGKSDQLLGLLQEKYGYSRERANAEIQDFINQYHDTVDHSKGLVRQTRQSMMRNRPLQVGLIIAAVSLLAILVYYFMHED